MHKHRLCVRVLRSKEPQSSGIGYLECNDPAEKAFKFDINTLRARVNAAITCPQGKAWYVFRIFKVQNML